MENKLNQSEFNMIVQNNSPENYDKLTNIVFKKCIDKFNQPLLSTEERSCIEHNTKLFLMTVTTIEQVFNSKLIK